MIEPHVPRFTVGVTGHRPNRMAIGAARVARRLDDVLAALRAGAGAVRPTALSALAEGTDRLFAEAALARGFRLAVVLPFARADYEQTFSDAAETPAFRALLARAAEVSEMGGSLAATKAAYEAVGHATVARSDVLVAVWDGKGAAGRGGTPEIIAHALRQRKPVIWIDAARDRLPMLLRLPDAGGARDLPLAALAARARPLSRRAIRRLGVGVGRR